MKIKKSTLTVVLLLFCSFLAGTISVEAEATFTVNSTTDAIDANPGDGICASAQGECTLRAAIMESNMLPGEDLIEVPAGTYLLTIEGKDEDNSATGDLDISGNLIIYGEAAWDGSQATIIQGNNADRVIHILQSATVEIQDLMITGGNLEDPIGGAGVFNLGYLHLYAVDVVNNSTSGAGGGIRNEGELFLDSSDVKKNQSFEGGGVYNLNQLHLYAASIYSNTTSGSGAGIYNAQEAYCGIMLTSIGFNTINGEANGGGIYNLGTLELDYVVDVTQNLTGGSGGGIYNSGTTQISDMDIVRNEANNAGGGIFNSDEATITISNGILEENTAKLGAAVHNQGDLLLSECSILNNTADTGGGLHTESGLAKIEKSLLYGNQALSGGAVYAGDGMASITDDTLPPSANTLSVLIDTSTISANTATNMGGAIYSSRSIGITNSTISGNGENSIYLSSNSSSAEIGNSIIAGSVSGENNCTGEPNISSLDHNLEAGNSCGLSEPHDLINTDPMLVISEDKPVLEFHPTSPAIDGGGNDLCGEVDQVGTTRPLDGDGDGFAVCDIGAYEAPEPDLIFADVPLNHWAYDYIIPLYEEGYIAGCATDPERLFCPEDNMDRAESSVFIVRGLHPDIPGYMPPMPTVQYFDDVPIGADEKWYSKWVGELNEQGFTSGCNEDPPMFCPEKSHIRAEATVFFLRMAYGPDFDPLEPSQQIYNDVAPDQWYYRWVNAAHEAGIIQPCQTDMENMFFRPEEDLTRAEAACMMMMAKELPSNPRGNSIVEAAFTDAALLNPIVVYDQASRDVNNKLFLGLINVDAFSGAIVGEIAESWEVSADGLTYTFNLREDIFWTDGTPVTAKDVKFTYEAIGSEHVDSPIKYSLAPIESIEVVNDHTLRMTFYIKDCSALQDFTVGILPAHMYADDFSDIYDNPLNLQPTVTNGPFKFDEWVKGDHITLVRNDTYYLGAPDIEKWIRRIYADTPSAMAAFLAGQVDIMDVEQEDVATIESEIANGEPFAIKPLLSDGYSFLTMNNGDPNNPEMGWVDENENGSFDEGEPANIEQGKHPILSDKLVRQAIAYAIDYDDIIQQVALGQGAPLAANVIPAVEWAYHSNLEPYALDTEKAALLLDEAGWVLEGNGVRMKDGKPLALSIMTNAGNTDREKMTAMIKDNLAALGFDITVELLDWGEIVRNLLNQEFDMVVLGWIGLGSDPDDTELWAYRYDEPGVGLNFTSYYSEEVESKLFEANSLVGCPIQDRAALYHDIQAQIHEDAPYAFLFTPMTNVAWNTRLQGINPGPWSTYYNVEEWSITP